MIFLVILGNGSVGSRHSDGARQCPHVVDTCDITYLFGGTKFTSKLYFGIALVLAGIELFFFHSS